MIKTILFDFGGVLAEEGFREGLKVIGRKNGLDPDAFFFSAEAIIYETGYLTGNAGERAFWNTVRERTGITEKDQDLREEILTRFILRQQMIELADQLRSLRFRTAILSDQTNWLEEINEKTMVFRHFDQIFNSFRMHKSKKDVSVFAEVCREMGAAPGETIFIDDNKNHVERAASAGLQTIHFTTVDDCRKKLHVLIGTS